MAFGKHSSLLRTRNRLHARSPRVLVRRRARRRARRPQASLLSPAKLLPSAVCYSDQIGRILKSDHSGRSFWAHHRARLSGVWQLTVLSELKIGESGILVALDLPESVQNHLMHMGFVPSALVTVLRRAPAGDPTVYAVDGMEIALRSETAQAISVRATHAAGAAAHHPETLAEAAR